MALRRFFFVLALLMLIGSGCKHQSNCRPSCPPAVVAPACPPACPPGQVPVPPPPVPVAPR